MIKFILFILIIFLFMLFLGIGFISRFVRLFIKRPNTDQGSSYSKSQREKRNYSDDPNKHQKIFGEDEGEYIDYEEIK